MFYFSILNVILTQCIMDICCIQLDVHKEFYEIIFLNGILKLNNPIMPLSTQIKKHKYSYYYTYQYNTVRAIT